MDIIFQDDDLIVYDKPAGINCDDFPLRIHRLDKDTSGVFLVAKNKSALEFFQKQFQEREVGKKYLALVVGHLPNDKGEIQTLIGRAPGDRRKQKVYSAGEPEAQDKRTAVTLYRVLQRFESYDLIEAEPKTGRKHQIRTHLSYLGHPIAGDKLYGFKGQIAPQDLKRQFLHASAIKIQLLNGQIQEFKSDLPPDLQLCLTKLNHSPNHI